MNRSKGLWRRAALPLLLAIVSLVGGTPAVAAPDISVYGNLPGFERAALSPSGKRVALIGVVGDKRSLVVLDVTGTPKTIAVSAVGDRKVRSIYWAGDDIVLVEISNTATLGPDFTAAKAELSAMIVFPLNGTKAWSVFATDNRITGGVRGYYGSVERRGRWYGYFGGITYDGTGSGSYLGSTHPVLYEVDLASHSSVTVARRSEDGVARSWLIGPDGKVVATFDFTIQNGSWTIVNAAHKIIARGTNPLGNADLIGFGRTPGTLVYDSPDEHAEDRWFEVPIEGGTPTEILHGESIANTYMDQHGGQMIGYAIDGDVPSDTFFDPHRAKVMAGTRRAFPGLSATLIDWNDMFDRLIVRTEGVGDPQTWWLVDIKTHDASVLGTSYPIRSADVAPMRMIHYKAADGLDIAAVLTLPPGREAKNLPVVVFPHGGPAARDYPRFDWWAQAFAARGYAVLQPNFRGSTGYGTAFELAGHGEWGRKMQTDISDGLADLVKQGIVDPKRACIMGGSYGGYAALAGVTLQHGLYRCAVSWGGVSDVQKMAANDIEERGDYADTTRRALAAEVGKGRDLRLVSPARFAAQADAPVLLMHGKDDTVVQYGQSNDMAAALRAAGKPVELVPFPGEDHWLSKGSTRLKMLQTAIAFVEKYNPADPVK